MIPDFLNSILPEVPGKLKILIVEDEFVIAIDLKESLESLGYNVLAIANSGMTAIEMATQLRPDLVLMDIRLQGDVDGTEAAAQIWDNLQIPVVYASGHSDVNTLERVKATASFGYILKPFEARELYVAIETAMQQFRLYRKLQAREKWLKTILSGIGDGVVVVDPQTRITFLNLVAESLTGWRQEEALGKAIVEVLPLVHEQTRIPMENPVVKAIAHNLPIHLLNPTLLLSKDGREIPIGDSVVPIRDDDGTLLGGVLVFRDLTEERLIAERNLVLEQAKQLENQITELQRLDRLKDDFLSQVSHEMRSPLTNIKMSVQMLQIALEQEGMLATQTSPRADSITRYLRILGDQCDRELSLVNDLLDMQYLDAETYHLELSEIYLQDFIPHHLEGFQDRIAQRQQRLQMAIDPDLPPIVSDWSSLCRILSELVNNACKYTPPDGEIIVTAELSASDRIEILVSNTGVEIPAAELPRIFDRFYRIPSTDRWQQGGTGLGLALIQKLVTYLGGSIRVESETGLTRFMVELPVGDD